MARLVHDSNTKIYWAPAIANKAAPTVAEMTGATDVTPQVPSDGLATNPTRNNASQSMLDSSFVAEAVGTWSMGITLTFMRDDGTDAAWDLFDYGTNGFLVISRFGGGETALDEVEVYPAESHLPTPMATAENEYQKFEVQLAVTDDPALNAVVAA